MWNVSCKLHLFYKTPSVLLLLSYNKTVSNCWSVSVTTSAVKSSPDVTSSINICFVSAKVCVIILEIVKSVLPLSSIISPVSAESEAVTVSPVWNIPETLVKITVVPEVPI